MSELIKDYEKEIEQMKQDSLREQSQQPVFQSQIEEFTKALANAKYSLEQCKNNIQRYVGGISVLQNRINKLKKDDKIIDAVNAAPKEKPEKKKKVKLSEKVKLKVKEMQEKEEYKAKENEVLDEEVKKLLENPPKI